MKNLTSLCAPVIAAVTLAAPATVFAGKNGYCASGAYYGRGGGAVYVSGGRACYGGGYAYRPYCAPVAAYRPYCAPRAYYGGGWGYYGAPAISLGFYSAPAYYGTSAYYDSYPTRTVYRGVQVNGPAYRNGNYDDALAVDVQRALARRGFYRGAIDGDVGPGTRAAIRSYQYNRGFEVTGRIDNALLRSLGLV